MASEAHNPAAPGSPPQASEHGSSNGAVTVRLNRLLEASPFTRLCRMAVAHVDPDAGRLTMTLRPRRALERVRGSGHVHGGVLTALIDTAACFALAMRSEEPPPTVDLRADFLRAAGTSELRATAVVRRAGRSVGCVDVDVVDESGELVALGRATFSLRN